MLIKYINPLMSEKLGWLRTNPSSGRGASRPEGLPQLCCRAEEAVGVVLQMRSSLHAPSTAGRMEFTVFVNVLEAHNT